GINNCNKQFLMAAVAYNLKKYLKFEYNRPWGSLNPCFRVSFWLCFSRQNLYRNLSCIMTTHPIN
ncbi:MAG: hypothetical protein ABJG41_00040, partial [Cyclobacteriaceae bacterium]